MVQKVFAKCEDCGSDKNNQFICSSCHMLASSIPPSDPFTTLALEQRFDLTEKQIEQAYEDLLILLHPDQFAGKEAWMQDISQQYCTAIQQAKDKLLDPISRAKELLKLHGIDHSAANLTPDAEFLSKIINIQEEIASGDAPPQLKTDIEQLFNTLSSEINSDFKKLEQSSSAKDIKILQNLGKLRYFSNILISLDGKPIEH